MFKWSIFLTLVLTNIVVCKPDYHFNQEIDGWLKLHVVPATWQNAFLNCHYEGAVLASPINSHLAAALAGTMHRRHLELELSSIYIGTNALFSSGDYFSIEGVPLADMNVTWNAHNDGKGPGDCLRLSEHGKVSTTTCEQLWLPYICYKKNDETTKELNECGTFDNEYNLNKTTGKCYKFHKDSRTWDKAHKICAAEGAHLAIINDKQEAEIITDLFPGTLNKTQQIWQKERAYIGLRDWNKDNTWLTIHGEKIENVYHTWARGQPINFNDCGCILRDGTLEAIYNTKLMFVCEKDPSSSRFENKFQSTLSTII